MLPQRHVRLFRNGSNQALRIPREFELPGNEAIMKKDGNRLIIESVLPSDLLGLLASWDALDVDFPDIDADALPLDDVDL
jgi:antitoxin VapB